MLLDELVNFDAKRFYRYAIYFFFVTHFLDWATTFFGTRVLGFTEANELLSDAVGNPLHLKALIFKMLYALIIVYVLGEAARLATKSYTFAGAIWLYFGLHNYAAASGNNLMMIFNEVWTRLGW